MCFFIYRRCRHCLEHHVNVLRNSSSRKTDGTNSVRKKISKVREKVSEKRKRRYVFFKVVSNL